jgi:glycosyltransferase involved in cell wall biosynthesis
MTQDAAKVLILTPVKSAAQYLNSYFQGLSKLTYPKTCLSLGILEGDSTDATFAEVENRLPSLGLTSARLWKKDFGLKLPGGVPRHELVYQFTRRAVLARARNHLLFRALDSQDWVLWLDVDIIDYPPDIIERLLNVDRDIVQPHCVTERGGPTFDRNAWKDNGQFHMDQLRGRGLVRLDAVGGTMLLVRADRHRDGLVFPAYFYGRRSRWIRSEHPLTGADAGEIETEGLGIMAKDMGLECWGLPDLEVLHAK